MIEDEKPSRRQMMVEFVRRNPDCTATAVGKEFGMSARDIYHGMSKLKQAGLLVVTKQADGTKTWRATGRVFASQKGIMPCQVSIRQWDDVPQGHWLDFVIAGSARVAA